MRKRAKKVWVICADPSNSSCIVNAVYEDREEALKWVVKENNKLGYDLYWVEQSELIRR